MIDGKTVNHSHSRSPSSSKLSFDMSKIGDSARCGECGKTNHLVLKIVLLCLNKKEKYIDCIICNMWNI